ncbi:hypothetical protein F0267_28490 [Vibrio coralliilyticus]|uniref:Uncharacterized protein n=1 Tax=Vibrio coralliilyticus TaxID=190893 RepID=A0AAN0SAK1_9VIBR|nr:hypothetical protein [Vibrio coralliilyticus]AIW18582.1 hypothetical protein IX92_05770 [Vibrio coralliilyticus]NOH42171.1 hypothetical protein [Vibrio coralliilyticus]
MSESKPEYSKELVVVVNSIAAFVVVFILHLVYGAFHVLILSPEGNSLLSEAWFLPAAIIGILVSVGLILRKEWARKISLFAGLLGLLVFPVGTVVSICLVVALHKNRTYYI